MEIECKNDAENQQATAIHERYAKLAFQNHEHPSQQLTKPTPECTSRTKTETTNKQFNCSWVHRLHSRYQIHKACLTLQIWVSTNSYICILFQRM